jgi:deoxyribodipyrimidine photo-lyase
MRKKLIPKENTSIHVKGGRSEALLLLKTLPENYDKERDIPSKRTSNLSAHNHFGTVSIREVYHAAKRKGLEEMIRQLYWRDFYGHIMADFENLYGTSAIEFQKDSATPISGITWKYDRELFNKWCRGETGHDLVDAGMRQLNETGYIHNRARLVCAYYLVKDLKIFWRWGERYFASKLVSDDLLKYLTALA